MYQQPGNADEPDNQNSDEPSFAQPADARPRSCSPRRGLPGRRINTLHGSDEPITLTRHGRYICWFRIGVTQYLAQLRDRLIDRSGADDHSSPDLRQQLLDTDNAAFRINQTQEEAHGARLEFLGHAAARN